MYLADTLFPAPGSSIVHQEENNFDVSSISRSCLEELKRHTADDTTLENTQDCHQSSVIRHGAAQQTAQSSACHLPLLSLQRWTNYWVRSCILTSCCSCIVVWPNVTDNKEIQSCSQCTSTKSHWQKEPLQPHPSALANCSNFSEWCSQQYLVLADSNSGWYEMDLLRDVTSDATLISDNGRLITSQ